MKKWRRKQLTTLFIIVLTAMAFAKREGPREYKKEFALRGVMEYGFLGVLSHKIQFSESGTYFDYKNDGGQNNLFPTARVSVEFDLFDKNTFYLLYQPLTLETQSLLSEDLIVDDQLFPAGTPMNFLYNFPFYRFSYTRKIVDKEQFTFDIGATIQIRNATIRFASQDGTMYRDNSDIGIVPALKIRMIGRPTEKFWLGFEMDGMYAPVSYLNGSDDEIVGAILDASLRAGIKVFKKGDIFFNYRYLGGGATGTDNDNTGPGDGYVKNWLHFNTVTLGAQYEFSWKKED